MYLPARKVETSTVINNDLLEAQIVAQAITELQEIQGPVVQHVPGDDIGEVVRVVTDCGVDTEQVDTSGLTQTQVIYYIEDGNVARTEDRTLVDSSVQANDYEIERRSGRVPSRKRVIPVKFRDYKNTSGDETSDSDYDPNEYKPRPRKQPKATKPSTIQKTRQITGIGKHMKAGRPRKNFMPTHTVTGQEISVPSVSVSDEVEKKFQEALRVSREEASVRVVQEITSALEGNQVAEKQHASTETEVGDQQQETDAGIQNEDDIQNAEHGTNLEEDQSEETVARVVKQEPNDQQEEVISKTVAMPVKRGRGRPRGPAWEKFYKCPDCNKTFNQKGNLRAHLRVHTEERPFPCQEEGCGKSFRSNESLRRHLLSHQGIKPFECGLCGKKFSSNVALIEHCSRHMDLKPHECPHCQKKFRQVSCLRRHVAIHSGELPFECNVCHRKFAQTSYLKSHMKVHTGEKPFKCDVCDKRFAHQSDVRRHRTTHTGEKPYACSKCQAKFSDVSSKNRHEKEHENSKRYKCHLCGETFKRTGQLRSHLNRKHSHTFAVKIEKDPGSGGFSVRYGEDSDPSAVPMTQQRIVSLIKNLHSKTVGSEGFTEISNVSLVNLPETVNHSDHVTLTADQVTDISHLEKEVDPSVIESDMGVPIELQGVEIQGEEAGQTFIAITDLADSLTTGTEKVTVDKQPQQEHCHYRIIYEIDENGQQKQMLVPVSSAEDIDNLGIQVQYSSLNVEGNDDTVIDGTQVTDIVPISKADAANDLQTEVMHATDTITECEEVSEQDFVSVTLNAQHIQTEETVDFAEVTLADQDNETENVSEKKSNETDSNVDYVNEPDFSSQDYYNWLTNFTELCKVVPMPLDMSLFQKISQVHKTLSDIMATPSGVIADRENFRVLMNISKELSTIINEHLVYVLENLTPEDKAKQQGDHDTEIGNV